MTTKKTYNSEEEQLVKEYFQGKIKLELTNRTESILMARFGIARKRTLEEVGRSWGISRERIRQIEAQAIHEINKAKTHGSNQ